MIQICRNYLRLTITLLFAFLLFTAHRASAQDKIDCGKKLTRSAETYPRDSELYYLSIIEHGDLKYQIEAAKRLLKLENKTEFDISNKIWRCRKRVGVPFSLEPQVRDLISLVLFDHDPEKYKKDVTEIVSRARVEMYGIDVGSPFRDRAAARLVQDGYFDKKHADLLVDIATSPFLDAREEAAKAFARFDGIPPYDPAPEEWTDKIEADRKRQLKAIKKWFSDNTSRLKWSETEKKYTLIPNK